jgi:hypothetical protein
MDTTVGHVEAMYEEGQGNEDSLAFSTAGSLSGVCPPPTGTGTSDARIECYLHLVKFDF